MGDALQNSVLEGTREMPLQAEWRDHRRQKQLRDAPERLDLEGTRKMPLQAGQIARPRQKQLRDALEYLDLQGTRKMPLQVGKITRPGQKQRRDDLAYINYQRLESYFPKYEDLIRLKNLRVARKNKHLIDTPFHGCDLVLVGGSMYDYDDHDHVRYRWCASCHNQFPTDPKSYYKCSRSCDFYMDVKCALMEPIKCEEGQPHIQHFSHQHPMPLMELCFQEKVCFACQSPCLGSPTYACRKCEYFLHKRCAECPTEVTHPSHPNHPLFLHINHKKDIRCNSCERQYCAFIFKCSQRNWNVCIECYLLPKHINHDPFVLHSHRDQPQPQDLTLSIMSIKTQTKFTCHLCHNTFKSSSPRFECAACGFVVDVECALTPPVTRDGQGYFQHFNHPHAMSLVEIDSGDEICFACNLSIKTRGLAYSCTKCKSFLHKSCAEFPLKLHYPLHKHPCLTFLPPKESGRQSPFCWLCHRKDGCGFLFGCSVCEFMICLRCNLRNPSIKYEGHPHRLCLVEKVQSNLECNAYDGYCKLPVTSVELCTTESSMFRCVDCNFNVHLLCGPLPRAIEYEYHVHTLFLVDQSPAEDSSDEYYCDICENERDPRICVYYCQESKFTAHVHCVTSEVVAALRGHLTDKELKTVRINGVEKGKETRSEVKSSALETFKDKISTLPDYEQIMLWHDFNWDALVDQESQQPRGENLGHQAPTWIRRLSRFTIEYFENFFVWLNELYYSERLNQSFCDLLNLDVVNVEGYMIPRNLARILVLILRKHGDISSNSVSTSTMKSLTFCFLCRVLHDMSRTKLVDVTKVLLKEWCFYLNYAQRRGFNTEFMSSHLKDLARAFVGLQATAARNGAQIKSIQPNDILKLQNELDDLKAKRYDHFMDWGEFPMESLSMALKLIEWDHVGLQSYV